MSSLPLIDPAAPAGPVARGLDLLARGCVLVAGCGLVTLIAIFGWLVWGRYVMNDTPTWVEQLAILLVSWITFLGAAAGVRSRSHLSIDFVRDAMPRPIREPLWWLATLGVLVFGACLAWQGTTLAQSTWPRTIPMLGVSEGLRAVPMALCGVFTVLFTLHQMAAKLRGEEI